MTSGDKVLLPPSATKLIADVLRSVTENGQQANVETVLIAGFNLIQIEVVGKRPGEGVIAASMKK
jgi:endonuclease V-like protein UPF0215 family